MQQLSTHNGLNYVPRERTTNGRVFEHAAVGKVLIDQLTQLEDFGNTKTSDASMGSYYVKIMDEPLLSSSKDGKSAEEEKNQAEIKLAEKY